MDETKKPALSCSELLAKGFEHVCEWRLEENRLFRTASTPTRSGVYAFCTDGIAQYVGVASRSLDRRLYLYGNPGISQATNIRINAIITNLLREGARVEVLIATPPDMEWNGWRIRGPEGLEASLIADFHLSWNVRGAGKQAAQTPLKAVAAKSPDSGSIEDRPRSPAGKYDALRFHLEECGKDRLSMTFRQIEDLVGKLPKSASLHQAWWANHEGNSQAKAWMEASYLVEANRSGRSVVFRKFTY